MTNNELPAAVVLITGHGNEAVAVDAMKLGVQDYLVKDHVNEGRLWRAIVRAVSQRELRQNLTASMRALTAANARLEQEVAAHEVTETELRAAKEAAELADRATTRFITMVTRELRAPLNGVLGYAQLLGMEGTLSPRQSARVDAMMQSGEQLFRLVDRVLDFASIASGRMVLHPAPLSVRDLTDNCIASVVPLAATRQLSVNLVWSPDAPRRIVADQARLRQVLLNLLDNAVKFTTHGWVELRVMAGASPDDLRIEVVDTGPGVAESDCDRLFRDFDHLNLPTAVEGVGLGLAIAARFIGLMGGTIGYQVNPRGGSIFWLEVPRNQGASTSPPDEVAQGSSSPGSRVLLVDDIAMSRDMIGAFLSHAGHEVRLAEGGRDGVRLAAEQRFDLILMDVRMPGMDGLEATRRIRALPDPNGHVPILALTACCLPEQILECRAAGMDGHVAKPVERATLMRAVGGAIGRCSSSHDAAWLPAEPGDRRTAWLDQAALDPALATIAR